MIFNQLEQTPAFENIPLSDLLSITGEHDTNPAKQETLTKKFKIGGKLVQGWLNVSYRSDGKYMPSLDVVPSVKLLRYVNENMLDIEYDQIYFEAIPFSDGTMKLYARYNQIIGSRFLGWFDASELESRL